MIPHSFYKQIFPVLASIFLFIGGPVFASDASHDNTALTKDKTPAETIKAAIQGNNSFITHHDHASFETYQKGQTPNVNGESNPNTIMRSKVLQELSKAEIVTHVGSLAPSM